MLKVHKLLSWMTGFDRNWRRQEGVSGRIHRGLFGDRPRSETRCLGGNPPAPSRMSPSHAPPWNHSRLPNRISVEGIRHNASLNDQCDFSDANCHKSVFSQVIRSNPMLTSVRSRQMPFGNGQSIALQVTAGPAAAAAFPRFRAQRQS
jgi:hypothetical protein